MTEPAKQGSAVAEYARVLRANRWLVLLIVVVCGGGAIVASLLQQPSYEATASLAYRDVSQDLGVIGVAVAQVETPAELAAGGAQTATDPEVAEAVKARLGTSRSARSLAESVEADVNGTSNFVALTASADSASGAVQLADAFATEASDAANERARTRFREAASQVRAKIAGTPKTSATRIGLQERLSNLETLSSLAEPARVVERAEVPQSPASPKIVFNAALGLIVGVILAMIAAFLRSSVDRRLKEPREAEQELDLPMVGKLRSEALGRGPMALNGTEVLTEADLESLRILRRNVDFLAPGEQVTLLAVTSPLPEEGKSTVAIALAFLAAGAGRRTLLVETDLRRPVFAERLGLASSPGLTDCLLGEAERDAAVTAIETALPASASENGAPARARPGAELFCLPAGTPVLRTDDLLGSAAFKAFVSQAAEDFDLVVFDTSPLLPVADTLEVVPLVDGLLLCVRLDQTTRDQAVAARETLARLPQRPTGIVVTGITATDEGYGSYAYTHSYERVRS